MPIPCSQRHAASPNEGYLNLAMPIGGRPGVGVPSSALISAFSPHTGVGQTTATLFALGLLEEHLLFRIRRGVSDEGYTRSVSGLLGAGGADAPLSMVFGGKWGRAIENYDFVQFGSPHFFHLADRAPHSAGIVFDLLWEDPRVTDLSPQLRWYMRREMKHLGKLNGVVTISKPVDEEVHRLYPGIPTNVIECWSSDDVVPRAKQPCRKLLGLPPEKTLLLSVGTAAVRKNLALLPEVLELLGEDTVLVRIGPSEALQRRLRPGSLIVRNRVSASQYPIFLNASDMLLAPSISEGLGRPVMDAINSQLPVVASDIPIFRDVLGATYPYLAGPSDPALWAEHIRQIRSEPESFGRTLFRSVGDRFRSSRGLRDYLRFYSKIGVLGA